MSLVVSWLLSRVTAIKTSTYKEMFLPLCYCVQNIPVCPYACSVEDNAPSSTTICSQNTSCCHLHPHLHHHSLPAFAVLWTLSDSLGPQCLSKDVCVRVCACACACVCVRWDLRSDDMAWLAAVLCNVCLLCCGTVRQHYCFWATYEY